MTDFTADLQELQSLYRFALILADDPAAAESVVDQCLQDAVKKPIADPHRHFLTLVLNLRKQLLEKFPSSEAELRTGDLPATASAALAGRSKEELLTAVRRLSEPERSACAMWHLELLDSHDLAKVLGLTDRELSLKLQSARLQLLDAMGPPSAA